MRKTIYSLLSVCVVFLLLFSGTACQSLSPDHIKANDHLQKGNENYTKEIYKKAIVEYEEALAINPELKKLYFYIGLAGSTAFKPALLRPEEDSTYGERKAQLEQIELIVTACKEVTDRFEANSAAKAKLDEIASLEVELGVKNNDLEGIAGYPEYIKAYRDINSLTRKIEHDKAQIEKKKSEEELKNDAPAIVVLNEDIALSESKIVSNTAIVQKFENSALALPVKTALKEIENRITISKSVLKGIPGFDEYIEKKEKGEAQKRLLGANTAYLRRSEDNEFYREKALKYLHLAEEFEPDRDEVTFALSEFYQKLNNIDKAEVYYKKIMAKDPENPKNFYILADFYANNQRPEMAIKTYEERIALDPKNPEGYHYFTGFLHSNRMWERAFDMHQKRISALLNPDIIALTQEIDGYKAELQGLQSFEKLVDNLNKNKALPKAAKDGAIQEALDKRKTEALEKIGSELAKISERKAAGKANATDEKFLAKLTADKQSIEAQGVRTRLQLEPLIADKEAVVNGMLEEAEKGIPSLPEETKKSLSEAYYAFGQDLWNKSYQTPNDEAVLPKEERRKIIQRGLAMLEKTTKLEPDFPSPYSYIGLLYREMIKVEPAREKEFIAKNSEYSAMFTDLYRKKIKQEQYQKTLENLGEDK